MQTDNPKSGQIQPKLVSSLIPSSSHAEATEGGGWIAKPPEGVLANVQYQLPNVVSPVVYILPNYIINDIQMSDCSESTELKFVICTTSASFNS